MLAGYDKQLLMPDRSCARYSTGVKSFPHKQDGLLAQLVEQLTLNQLVVGSNPSQPTTLFSATHRVTLSSLSHSANFHTQRRFLTRSV